MKKNFEAFWDFWLAPVDGAPAAKLRIGTAGIGLVQLVLVWSSLPLLFGNFGLVQWRVVDVARDGVVPGLSGVAIALAPLGVSSATVVRAAFALYGCALVALALGFRPRLAAAVALLSHVIASNSGALAVYGFDALMHAALFYLVLTPSAGMWSVDRWRGVVDASPTWLGRLGLRALQVHLCLVYLNAGIAKAQGSQWWSGEALWRALRSPQFEQLDVSRLAEWPLLLQAGCWLTLLLECGYAFAVWVPQLRRWWLLAIVGLHVGIAVLMGLWLFSALMIVLNVSCFWASAPRATRSQEAQADAAGQRAAAPRE